jgi:hypothetical protein
LAKDWENLNRTALAFLKLASIRLMLRKPCNPRSKFADGLGAFHCKRQCGNPPSADGPHELRTPFLDLTPPLHQRLQFLACRSDAGILSIKLR